MTAPDTHDTTDWRCTACRTLIGIASGDQIQVKYKTALFEIRGVVATRCRRCGTPSEFDTSLGQIHR